MRPVIKPDALSVGYDVTHATLTFTGTNAVNMQARFGTASLPLDDCLALWDSVVASQSPSAWERLIVTAINEKIKPIYGAAAPGLKHALGGYCAYCEIPLLSDPHVEHTVNKSGFPTFSCDWKNFLLACAACNRAKGRFPTRDTCAPYLSPGANPNAYYYLIRNWMYVWPDVGPFSYRAIRPVLYGFVGAGGWQALPDAVAVNPMNRFLGMDRHQTVHARLWNGSVSTDMPVQLRMVGMQEPAEKMVNLVQLNRDSDRPSDQRLAMRTRVWFDVLLTIDDLLNTSDFQRVWAGALRTAKYSGFYSIWVWLLTKFDAAQAFVSQTNNHEYFPRTNTTYVP
jgi:hypothetical protein